MNKLKLIIIASLFATVSCVCANDANPSMISGYAHSEVKLRDYFAAQIAAAYVMRGEDDPDKIAQQSYRVAAALLIERQKGAQ